MTHIVTKEDVAAMQGLASGSLYIRDSNVVVVGQLAEAGFVEIVNSCDGPYAALSEHGCAGLLALARERIVRSPAQDLRDAVISPRKAESFTA